MHDLSILLENVKFEFETFVGRKSENLKFENLKMSFDTFANIDAQTCQCHQKPNRIKNKTFLAS